MAARPKIPDPEAGFSLLATVGLLVLVGVIATGLLALVWTTGREGKSLINQIQGEYLAEAAYEYLLVEARNGEVDLSENLPLTNSFELMDTKFEVLVLDDDARLNISRAPLELLEGYFSAKGLPLEDAKTLAARIMDWRDPDNLAREGGAEAADYRLKGKEGLPGNAPFSSIDEMRLVLGAPELLPGDPCFGSDLTVYSSRALPYGEGKSPAVQKALDKVGTNLLIQGREGAAGLKTLRLFITPGPGEGAQAWEAVIRLYGRGQANTARVLFWQRAVSNWRKCLG